MALGSDGARTVLAAAVSPCFAAVTVVANGRCAVAAVVDSATSGAAAAVDAVGVADASTADWPTPAPTAGFACNVETGYGEGCMVVLTEETVCIP